MVLIFRSRVVVGLVRYPTIVITGREIHPMNSHAVAEGGGVQKQKPGFPL